MRGYTYQRPAAKVLAVDEYMVQWLERERDDTFVSRTERAMQRLLDMLDQAAYGPDDSQNWL